MSAAEKLKDLDERGHRLYLNGIDVDLHPQIVAVVEAAENQRREAYGLPLVDKTMDAALAALEEALS